MTNVLVLYASKHGHTAKIAERIANRLRESGATVDALDIASADTVVLPGYDTVVVGASIHVGHHQHEIVEWISHHATTLSGLPAAFFSVSLSAAEDDDEARAGTRKYVDDLIDDTGWTPRLAVSFAGALQYREYDFATRMLMRLLMARGHHSTDITKDTDYTDWDAVDAFAQDVAELTSRLVKA